MSPCKRDADQTAIGNEAEQYAYLGIEIDKGDAVQHSTAKDSADGDPVDRDWFKENLKQGAEGAAHVAGITGQETIAEKQREDGHDRTSSDRSKLWKKDGGDGQQKKRDREK